MKILRVPVADTPECAIALGHAFNLAQRLGADVVGTHIRTDKSKAADVPSDLWMQPMIFDSHVGGQTASSDASARDNAERVFAAVAREFGLTLAKHHRKDGQPAAIWEEVVGTPQRIMPIIGPMSDMLVVSRPKRRGGKTAKLFMFEALMHSHRPVLILPQRKIKSVGKTIAVAWNQSGEATRAVAQSLPLLRSAEKVVILSAGAEDRPGPKSKHLAHYLTHHGIKTKIAHSKGHAPDKELMEAYEDNGCDLMVMGAYSRSRLSEMIFGGVTQYMLYDARVPVLMLHS